MSDWSLEQLLSGLHDDIEARLRGARERLGHSVAKGDASEGVWLELLETYLPARYSVAKAFVVDSKGKFSDQLDVVVFDRQYSPIIFSFKGQTVIPAESVYAVFEAKQSVDAGEVAYAQKKLASVRVLHRTSLPIPHAGGTYDAKAPHRILGGLLAFESGWKPALGSALEEALKTDVGSGQLDLGCVAAHGIFIRKGDNYVIQGKGKPATAMLLELIAQLQEIATVPMIDVRAYSAWLPK